MGTRGLLGYIIRGERRGSFHRYDSYPEGLGKALIAFILSLEDDEIDLMAARMDEVEWIVDPDDEADSVRFADELSEIREGTRTSLPDDTDFMYDPLFCEWVYFIDFNARTLEIISGLYGSHVARFEDLTPKYCEDVDLWGQDTGEDSATDDAGTLDTAGSGGGQQADVGEGGRATAEDSADEPSSAVTGG